MVGQIWHPSIWGIEVGGSRVQSHLSIHSDLEANLGYMKRGASVTVQWVKVPAAKPEELDLIPEPMWWKERAYSCKLSSDLCRDPGLVYKVNFGYESTALQTTRGGRLQRAGAEMSSGPRSTT